MTLVGRLRATTKLCINSPVNMCNKPREELASELFEAKKLINILEQTISNLKAENQKYVAEFNKQDNLIARVFTATMPTSSFEHTATDIRNELEKSALVRKLKQYARTLKCTIEERDKEIEELKQSSKVLKSQELANQNEELHQENQKLCRIIDAISYSLQKEKEKGADAKAYFTSLRQKNKLAQLRQLYRENQDNLNHVPSTPPASSPSATTSRRSRINTPRGGRRVPTVPVSATGDSVPVQISEKATPHLSAVSRANSSTTQQEPTKYASHSPTNGVSPVDVSRNKKSYPHVRMESCPDTSGVNRGHFKNPTISQLAKCLDFSTEVPASSRVKSTGSSNRNVTSKTFSKAATVISEAKLSMKKSIERWSNTESVVGEHSPGKANTLGHDSITSNTQSLATRSPAGSTNAIISSATLTLSPNRTNKEVIEEKSMGPTISPIDADVKLDNALTELSVEQLTELSRSTIVCPTEECSRVEIPFAQKNNITASNKTSGESSFKQGDDSNTVCSAYTSAISRMASDGSVSHNNMQTNAIKSSRPDSNCTNDFTLSTDTSSKLSHNVSLGELPVVLQQKLSDDEYLQVTVEQAIKDIAEYPLKGSESLSDNEHSQEAVDSTIEDAAVGPVAGSESLSDDQYSLESENLTIEDAAVEPVSGSEPLPDDEYSLEAVDQTRRDSEVGPVEVSESSSNNEYSQEAPDSTIEDAAEEPVKESESYSDYDTDYDNSLLAADPTIEDAAEEPVKESESYSDYDTDYDNSLLAVDPTIEDAAEGPVAGSEPLLVDTNSHKDATKVTRMRRGSILTATSILSEHMSQTIREAEDMYEGESCTYADENEFSGLDAGEAVYEDHGHSDQYSSVESVELVGAAASAVEDASFGSDYVGTHSVEELERTNSGPTMHDRNSQSLSIGQAQSQFLGTPLVVSAASKMNSDRYLSDFMDSISVTESDGHAEVGIDDNNDFYDNNDIDVGPDRVSVPVIHKIDGMETL